ncbi:hypothetical protein TGAM01_v201714 [Trichoderma gamsii]|uniref:Uncharacterized protein n=1 Tax=Trichoderma gamsii TaxID=398673 RepID=A0A2P4ZYT7_9HYPO|nr:hypothetical protein TGAM01_v201714 [Trichoderma gamsii]PON29465.1 hypothetical protein TGAM01_v201714 [Trichoderma gamsii]
MHGVDEGVTENFDWNVGGEKAKRTPPDSMPCSQLVAAITIAMPSIKEWALGCPGRSGRILQSGAEHLKVRDAATCHHQNIMS